MEAGMIPDEVPNEVVLMDLVTRQHRDNMVLTAQRDAARAVYFDLRERALKGGIDVSDPRVIITEPPPAAEAAAAVEAVAGEPPVTNGKPPANRTARRAHPPRKSSGRKKK